jgi:ArsR family transcriptional regulator
MSTDSLNLENDATPAVAATVTQVAAMFKALGEPTRLRIVQFLRGCCCPVAVDEETGDVRPVIGPTVGDVCCHITGRERITSTISEHLKDLRVAGVILMERRGKTVICAVNPAALATLGAFFAEPAPAAADEGDRQVGAAGEHHAADAVAGSGIDGCCGSN